MVTPNSLAVSIKPFCSWSTNQGEYSIWRASIWASRNQVEPLYNDEGHTRTSLSKRLGITLAQTDVFGLSILLELVYRGNRFFQVLLGVDTVEVVQVWR